MSAKILVYGGSGLVGSRFVQLLDKEFQLIAPSHSQVDLFSYDQVRENIREVKPDQILYAAGFTNVDLAQEKQEEAYVLNSKVPQVIADLTSTLNIPLYYLSTDYVFDGRNFERPYTEEDLPNPVDSVYAKSKREGEQAALAGSRRNGVIRLIMPFSAVYEKKSDIARTILKKLQTGEKVQAVTDQKINPVFVDNLVYAIEKILERGASGIYHVGATDFVSPYEFSKKIARHFELSEDLIEEIGFGEFAKNRVAKRPQNTWLDTKKFRKEFGENILQTVDEELENFKRLLTDDDKFV